MPRLMSVDDDTRAERFWSKVSRGADDECWLWTRGLLSNGYGHFRWSPDLTIGSHRAAWWLTTGQDPRPLHVLHSCDEPRCCNPAHLRLGVNQDNVDDKMKRGRHPNTLMTECKHGHPFTPENTYVISRGYRQCRACNRRRTAEYAERMTGRA